MGKKIFKITLWSLLGLLAVVILVLGGYVIYLTAQYYRIEDNKVLAINNPQTSLVQLDTNYTITTYNIGFGAYSQDYTFFMDKGVMKNGKKVSGKKGRAKDKAEVLKNTNGAIGVVEDVNADFMLFQEVDVKATRSYKVNQYKMIQDNFNLYSNTFAYNFHSAYLFYPLTEPHGATDAGIATLSKYKIDSSVRRSFPVDNGFFARFFDLDRCFSVNRFDVDGTDKELVIINLHMSAYDKGGVIRAQQLKMLNDVLSAEYEKGNFVVAGGDFNHDIADSINLFETGQKVPSWVCEMDESQLAEGYSFASATNAPTCRSTDMVYKKGITYSVVIDGFVISDNVELVQVENIDADFEFSDHNPVKMQFKLKTA